MTGARCYNRGPSEPQLVPGSVQSEIVCQGRLAMSSRFIFLTVVLIFTTPAEGQLLAPPTAPNQIVIDATNVLTQSVAMPSGLPQKLVADAQGIAIVPNMVRGAFV